MLVIEQFHKESQKYFEKANIDFLHIFIFLNIFAIFMSVLRKNIKILLKL